ncbi:hypothetical protein CCMA1212_007024 [Trichoderma ghanense]|uniref:Uncharacterized protein n=1 Tax=Trichoderma ghanense TaxID=65468 RepID=A0ABY2H093_9HYPO
MEDEDRSEGEGADVTDDSRSSSQSGREISSRQTDEMEIEVDGGSGLEATSSSSSSSSWRRCDRPACFLGVLAQAVEANRPWIDPAAVEVPVAQGAAAREGGPYFGVAGRRSQARGTAPVLGLGAVRQLQLFQRGSDGAASIAAMGSSTVHVLSYYGAKRRVDVVRHRWAAVPGSTPDTPPSMAANDAQPQPDKSEQRVTVVVGDSTVATLSRENERTDTAEEWWHSQTPELFRVAPRWCLNSQAAAPSWLTTWQYAIHLARSLNSASRTHFREAGPAQLNSCRVCCRPEPRTSKPDDDSELQGPQTQQPLPDSSSPRQLIRQPGHMWEHLEFEPPRALHSPAASPSPATDRDRICSIAARPEP